MGIFSRLKGWLGSDPPIVVATQGLPSSPPQPQEDFMARIGAVRAVHVAELETTPAQRMSVYSIFNERLDREAHDYVDVVMAHPQREQVLELQVGVAMEAYFCGLMAKRGGGAKGAAAYSGCRVMRVSRHFNF